MRVFLIRRPDACGMYCNVMERKVMKKSTGKRENGGFSLVELIIVIAIMAVLVGVLAPQYLSYIHKAKVAADQANLKNYFTEIQLDYAATGVYNPQVPLVGSTIMESGRIFPSSTAALIMFMAVRVLIEPPTLSP